jgi:hypothetical protein
MNTKIANEDMRHYRERKAPRPPARRSARDIVTHALELGLHVNVPVWGEDKPDCTIRMALDDYERVAIGGAPCFPQDIGYEVTVERNGEPVTYFYTLDMNTGEWTRACERLSEEELFIISANTVTRKMALESVAKREKYMADRKKRKK